nr:cobaltochelatase subunit CobN [Thermoplasmatales archaeon]
YGHTNVLLSSRPGSYGSGVSNAVESGEWLSEGDLADVFLNWMGYAYGKGKFGIEAKTSLMEVSRDIDTLVHKREIDEIDIMDDSCNYSYAGGFYLLSKKSGSNPRLMFEDTFNPGNPKIRTMKDEIERTSVGKLLNGSWIDSQKNFGYRGATEMLKKIEHLYGWASTTRMVNDRIFDRVTEQFVINGDMREWFKKENPWAFEELTGRLIEAANRGIWKPAEGLLENLNEIYSGAESEAEN